MLSILGKFFSGQYLKYFFFFFIFPRKQVLTFQNLFSGENKTHIIVSSGELAQRVVKFNSKRQAKFVADNIYFYFFNFSKKTSLDISCESSAKQTIRMKYQDLFSLKN